MLEFWNLEIKNCFEILNFKFDIKKASTRDSLKKLSNYLLAKEPSFIKHNNLVSVQDIV